MYIYIHTHIPTHTHIPIHACINLRYIHMTVYVIYTYVMCTCSACMCTDLCKIIVAHKFERFDYMTHIYKHTSVCYVYVHIRCK